MFSVSNASRIAVSEWKIDVLNLSSLIFARDRIQYCVSHIPPDPSDTIHDTM